MASERKGRKIPALDSFAPALVAAAASLAVAVVTLIGGCIKFDRIESRVNRQESLQRLSAVSALEFQFDTVAASIDGVQNQITESTACAGVNPSIPDVHISSTVLAPLRGTSAMHHVRRAAGLIVAYRTHLDTGYYQQSFGEDDCDHISTDLDNVSAAVAAARRDLSRFLGG
jgi:hypothetical protein